MRALSAESLLSLSETLLPGKGGDSKETRREGGLVILSLLALASELKAHEEKNLCSYILEGVRWGMGAKSYAPIRTRAEAREVQQMPSSITLHFIPFRQGLSLYPEPD